MRTTKLLIGTLAVMSFAACQNEELVTNDVTNTPLLGREQINLTLNVQEPDTRLVNNNGKFTWEEGDQIGACLVDVTAEGVVGEDEHIGNYKFELTKGDFTTASTVSKGVYMFYYPYGEANTTSREGILTKELPPVQSWDENGDEMLKNNFMVSPIVNLGGYEGNTLTLPMTMRSIYGYGKIKITNSTNDAFEIQKIIISSAEKFALGTKLDPKDMQTAQSKLYVDLTAAGADPTELFAKADEVVTKSPYLTTSWIDKTNDLKPSENLAISALTNTTGVELAAGATKSTRVLIPAGLYAGANFKLTVYTDKGVKEFTGDEDGVTSLYDGTTSVRIPNSVVCTFNLDVTDVTPDDDGITAISTNDLIAGLKQYAGTESEDVKVTVVGPMTIDAGVMAQVPDNVTMIFQNGSNITFEGDMNLAKVKFADYSSALSTVTLKDGSFNLTDFTLGSTNKLTLDGATVTFGKNVIGGGNSNTYVNAESVLNITAAFTTYFHIDGGTLNINSAATRATAPIDMYWGNVNAGVLNINAPIANKNNLTVGDSSTKADVTINTNATVNVGSGNITINSDAKVVNNATLTINENNGTIDQESGSLTVTTNKGIINNNASAVAANSGTLTVGTNSADAIINTVADSQTEITANNGKIYFVKDAFINGTGTGANAENGNVIYAINKDMTVAELAAEFLNSPCTALEINNATLTIAASDDITVFAPLQAITMNNATAVVNKALTFNECPLFVYGTSVLEGTGSLAYAGDSDVLTVDENASLEVKVPISGLANVNNEGKVIARVQVTGDTDWDSVTSKGTWIGIAYKKI